MKLLHTLPLLALAACATAPVAPSPAASAPAASASAPAPSSLQKTVESAIVAEDWARLLPLAKQLAHEEPGNSLAWRYLGLAHVQLKDNPEAIPAFEKSLSLEDNAKTRANLGYALAMEGKVDQALPHFERSVALEPEYAAGWRMLARAQVELGRWDEAAVSIGHARRLLPEDVEVQRFSQAVALTLARSRLPGEALKHHGQGGVLSAQGRHAEAEKEYEAALKLAPGFADCHYNLGILARRRGDLARAEQEYRVAVDTFLPEEALLRADAMNNLADTIVSRGGDAKEAARLVREAITVRGERASYLDTLARACDAQGDSPCAAEAFRKLLASGAVLPSDIRTHAEKRLSELTP
ncbi:tetratricopeptide repeat protein [Archangium gephyra]|uniref:tetratricopeptide repeat protein n=1 Tax=Archangium gephyra TaxID=48 RepID=UPI0035D439E1